MAIIIWARKGRRLASAAALAVAMTAGLAAAAASQPANAAATSISLGGVGWGVAVDPVTDIAYISVGPATGTAYVAVVDLATDAITTTIPVAVAPRAIAVDPDTNLVYVLTSDDRSVSVISGATDTVTATIALGTRLNDETTGGIAVDPATDTVYAGVNTTAGVGGLAVINGATNTLTSTITAGVVGLPVAVGVDPATDVVYAGYDVVGGLEFPGVYVINGTTNSVSGTIDAPHDLMNLVVDPVSGLLYTANGYTVNGYTLATGTATGSVTLAGDSVGLAVDPQTATVFATPEVGAQNVTLISEADNAITGTIAVTMPSRVAVDPDTDTLVLITDADDATLIPLQ